MTLVKTALAKFSAMEKLIPISEAVAVNYKNANRYGLYNKLAGTKFKLGANKEYKVRNSEHYVMKFGPATNKLVKGKYVYILYDFQDTKRAKFGYITHFAVSSKDYSNGFTKQGETFVVDGLVFKPIPKDFVKFEHVMSLIIGAGADFDMDKSKITPAVLAGDNGEVQLDINKRFEIMAKLVRIVSMKLIPGMIIVGTGGLGKTYTVMETLRELQMVEEEDYIHIHGAKLTTTAFYQLLYENPEKLIIFDDSDSVLDSSDVINMLKSALDSGSGPRKVTYLSPAVENMGLETSFEFKGQIIFISNKRMVDFDQPLISRSVPVDVTMTREEVFERMAMIINKEKDEAKKGWMQKAFDALQAYSVAHPGRPKDLNMRTLGKIATILKADPEGGGEIADYLMSVS